MNSFLKTFLAKFAFQVGVGVFKTRRKNSLKFIAVYRLGFLVVLVTIEVAINQKFTRYHTKDVQFVMICHRDDINVFDALGVHRFSTMAFFCLPRRRLIYCPIETSWKIR
jgi:hypothetical protein